jgi:outer membrane lipoprotein-sorting protein
MIAEAKLLASTRPATDAELALAKSSILNSFVFNADSSAEILGQQLVFEYYGQPIDWLDRYQAAVAKVTAADVARVAAKYIHPDRFSIVVVGPSEGRDKPLAALGTVHAVDLTIPQPPASAPASAPAGAGASAGKPAMAPSGAGGSQAGSAGPPAADAKAKGAALVAKAVEALGGAAAIDGLKTYKAAGQVIAKTPQGEMTLETKETFALPDHFRQDMTLPFGQVAIVVAGADAWMLSPQGEQSMPSSMRGQIEEQVSSTPILLLRHRADAGFEAAAAGDGKAGDVTTALVAITFKGRTTTLGLDPKTGQVLSAAFRGAGPDGTPGDIFQTFSDFRPAQGLTLPFAQVSMRNGEVSATATLSSVAINEPVDEALWKRTTPKP